jgi:hypothetical protein
MDVLKRGVLRSLLSYLGVSLRPTPQVLHAIHGEVEHNTHAGVAGAVGEDSTKVSERFIDLFSTSSF